MESPEEGCPRYITKLDVSLPDPTIEKIISRIRERSNDGMKKYGHSLRDNHSKSVVDWINDAQEEAYDFIAYLEKLKEIFTGVKGV